MTVKTQDTSHARLPREVQILVAARVVDRLGGFTLTFLPLLLVTAYGASLRAAGLVAAAFGVATIPSRLLGGRLADRWGPRATIVLGLTGCAFAQLGLAVAPGLVPAFAAALLLGLCFEIYEPPSQALIADHVRLEDQPAAHGMMAAALAGSAVAAGVIATLLAGVDLRWLFVADAISCLGCALIVLRAVPPDVRGIPPRGASRALPRLPAERSPWRDGRLLVLLGVQTCFAVVYLQSTIALPLSLVERGQQAWTLGVLLVASALTMIAATPVMRRAPFRSWTRPTQLRVGYLTLGAGLAGYAVADSLASYVAASAVAAVGDLFLMGVLLTVVAGLAPPHGRARYLAVFGLSWGIAAILAPTIGIAMLSGLGVAATWGLLAGGCVTLGLLARTYLPPST